MDDEQNEIALLACEAERERERTDILSDEPMEICEDCPFFIDCFVNGFPPQETGKCKQ